MNLSTDPCSASLISDLNRLFDPVLDVGVPSSNGELSRRENPSPTVTGLLRPRIDLQESKDTDEMSATFELPGMKKEDVSIDVHQNRLIVSGQNASSSSEDKEGYAVQERRFEKFSRAIPLPTGIKPDDIKASMENGVLTVKFPKAHPDREPRRVTS